MHHRILLASPIEQSEGCEACNTVCALSNNGKKTAPLVNEDFYENPITEINAEVKQQG